jgi:hypothetical protein
MAPPLPGNTVTERGEASQSWVRRAGFAELGSQSCFDTDAGSV